MITIYDLPELDTPTVPATPCDFGVHVLCASPECTCDCPDHGEGMPS